MAAAVRAGRRFLCDLFTPDGEHFVSDSRAILKRTTANAAAAGFDVRIATDCEFYLEHV